jgi:hypothetical protein
MVDEEKSTPWEEGRCMSCIEVDGYPQLIQAGFVEKFTRESLYNKQDEHKSVTGIPKSNYNVVTLHDKHLQLG